MTNTHKDIISFLLGVSFTYLFVWLSALVAAVPIPELLHHYTKFVVSYYPNILIVLFASLLSLISLLIVRKVFTVFTKQNLFYFTLPIVLVLTYLSVFLNFTIVTLMYAAIPTLLVAMIISSGEQKQND